MPTAQRADEKLFRMVRIGGRGRRFQQEEVKMAIEYRVREIKRYIVTRFDGGSEDVPAQSCTQIGEYASGETAYQVGYAMCRQEHIKSGEPVGSINFIYPNIPDGVSVSPN